MANKAKIKIGHIQVTDHLVLGVTEHNYKNGLEKFEHTDLQTINFEGWNPLADAVHAGEVDAAFILAPLAMELFHSGAKIKLTLLGHKSGSVIIANKRANIRNIHDFKGKTVLIPHFLSVHNLIFEKLLRENGLTVGVGKDVTFEVLAPSQIPMAMAADKQGVIAGFIVAEPYGSQVVKDGFGEEFALSKDIWPAHPCCVVIMKEAFIERHPEAVQELTRSFVNSGLFIKQKPAEAAVIGASFLNQSVEVVQRVLTQPADRVKTDELLPVLKDLEFIQSYMTDKIKAMSTKINLEKFVDLQFAKTAGAL